MVAHVVAALVLVLVIVGAFYVLARADHKTADGWASKLNVGVLRFVAVLVAIAGLVILAAVVF